MSTVVNGTETRMRMPSVHDAVPNERYFFLSYSGPDYSIASDVVRGLIDSGVKIWADFLDGALVHGRPLGSILADAMTNASGCIFLEVGDHQSEINGHAMGYVELELSFALDLHVEMKREGQTWPIVRLHVGNGLSRPLVKDFRRVFPVICVESSFHEASRRHAAFLTVSEQLRDALIPPRLVIVPRSTIPGRRSILSGHRIKPRLPIAALLLLLGAVVSYVTLQVRPALTLRSVPTDAAQAPHGHAAVEASDRIKPSAAVVGGDVEKVEDLAKDPSANLGRARALQYTTKNNAEVPSGPSRTLNRNAAELR